MRETAALPLPIVTVWEAIVDAARVGPGQTVLVQGGTGGVGHVVVQIARAYGADVFATASTRHARLVESLGASFIDYQKEPVEQYLDRLTAGRGFDILDDTAGGTALDASFKSARQRGQVFSCLGSGTHSLAPLSMRAASYTGVFTLRPLLTGKERARHGDILRGATVLIESNKMRPLLDERVFEFTQAADAHALLGCAQHTGKVAATIAGT